MIKLETLLQNERSQYLIFLGVALIITAFTATLYLADGRVFQRFFGRLNPLLAIFITVLLGLPFLTYLLTRGFHILQKGNQVGLVIAAVSAALFGIVIILVDRSAPLPENINVAFPYSLLFYPTMGFVVDVVFHMVLLGILLLLVTPILKGVGDNSIIWICIVLVALVEPIYQSIFGTERPYTLWPDLYIALHIFLINLCQLAIFKRYDFISMYTFRLVYYLIWHVGWGYLRLGLLFN